MFRKAIGCARLSIISSQFQAQKKGSEERGANVSRTDRSCHLYGETQHCVSGRLKWQAWRDSRRGTNRPDRTAKKVSSTRCDRKRRRRRATSDYSRPPRLRKKAAIASKRPSRPCIAGETWAWEFTAQVDVKLDGESIVIKQWWCTGLLYYFQSIFYCNTHTSWISYIYSLHSTHLLVRDDYFLKKRHGKSGILKDFFCTW